MPAALLVLVLLIGATPAVVAFDGPLAQGLVTAGAAAGVGAVAWGVRPGEGGYLVTLVRPMAAIAAVPALWMAIQTLPLGTSSLAHPIWQSAAAALGRPVNGSISIDPGLTLVALVRYLGAAALVLLATAVAVDRQRAERTLFALVTAAGITAGATLIHDIAELAFLDGAAHAAATGCAALGAILAAAALVRTFERHETRRAHPGESLAAFAPAFVACFVAFAACAATVAWSANSQTIFAAAYGLVAFVAVIAIRRLGLGPWGSAAIGAAAIIIAVAVIASRPAPHGSDVTLTFADKAPARIAAAQSMLADATWAGSGAGSFAALLPIYRDLDDTLSLASAPTAAAAIAIELGRPMLWAIVLGTIAAIIWLLRGALARGRDSFYPAAGAASLVTLLLLAFADAAVLTTAVTTVAAGVVGLAAAQSKSRTVT
jgi:hypothetical protein